MNSATTLAASTSPAPLRRLGRFQLLRELGRGAQATVWLAHDPRLEREVALKHFHPDTEAGAVSRWLQEAHAVSRLTHAHIVPVFEAGEQPGAPYLVFEYVEGPTLAQARRQRPRLPPREAVTLMLGVLDALAAAHAQGIVHRDLKPSNVLLGGDGRARVMDFGIAARMAQGSGRKGSLPDAADGRRSPLPDAADGRIVGTPGYMSPEAARGEAPLPAMDVFAAGVILAELLAGEPLLKETDPWRAVHRVQHEDLVLPAGLPVDEALRCIVQRALERDCGLRYDSARSMHTALASWLQPPDAAAADAGANHATLEFLLRRMRRKSDFPALSASVARILQLAASETESLSRLSEEILKDVGLTHKLLRLVNAAHFTAAAGGGIATVSRAVALVGIAGIRNLVLSVLLLEHMADKGHAARLQQEFLRALMAGTLARELTPLARESEDAFLAGMFQNLGRLLTEYYFPEEALQIRLHAVAGADAPANLEASARRVLGIGFDDLSAGVALAWGLPSELRRALRRPEAAAAAAAPGAPAAGVERLRWLGHSANLLTDMLMGCDGDDAAAALVAVAERHAPVLGCSVDAVVAAAHGARVRLRLLAQAMGLQVADASAVQRLLGAAAPRTGRSPARHDAAPASAGLAQGLGEVRAAALARSLRLNELLHLVLDTMQRALHLRCVVLCLREPHSGHLTGRVGLGLGAAAISAAFRIAPDSAATGDLFAALCAKGADLLIADAATVASRLPAWYRQRVNAPTFLLLPLLHQGAPIGLVYGDKAVAGTLVLADAELALLRALRDEAVAAFRRG